METYLLDILGPYAILNKDEEHILMRLEHPAENQVLMTVISTHPSHAEAMHEAQFLAASNYNAANPEPVGGPVIEGS